MRTNLSSQISLNRVSPRYYRPGNAVERSVLTRLEKIPTNIFETIEEGVEQIANEIVAKIQDRQREGKFCTIAIGTGASLRPLFTELIRKHKDEGVSFRNVVFFNLYEYYPLVEGAGSSFNHLNKLFLSQIDIDHQNIFTMDGSIPQEAIIEHCRLYEQRIQTFGGLDMVIMGIGREGNIGMNEPGSHASSTTRLILVDATSRSEAARNIGVDNLPPCSITMGINTIMGARKIYMLAWGEDKADIIRSAIEDKVSDTLPASYLQLHTNTTVCVDLAGAAHLTRIQRPWLVTSCEWNDKLVRSAIVWLCTTLNKPILKLTNKDYNENGLSELLALYGSAYNANIKVFNDLQHTITGWPGGKPNADDSTRPERAYPYPKRILIFSPHPDDDVISMGGTFARLVEQGHEVHVAYQTSGSIAVFDDYIYQQMDIATSFTKLVDGDLPAMENAFLQIKQAIANRKPGDEEARYLLQFKAALRRAEARGACRFIGVPEERVHFLNLPFYETGKVKKNPLSQADVDIIVDLLRKVQPHQIYAAGDLADPHGTHGVCLDAILRAYNIIDRDEWFKDCNTWWYRGAWMEWEVEKVDMAVPISPAELSIKRKAIYKHGSQNNGPAFPGDDPREFWQRAEDRNRNTADLYNRLGMAEYEAMEVFTRYKHDHGDSLK